MTRFYPIPAIPTEGVEDWKVRTIGALKQNVELLTGTRGEVDNASRAVLQSTVTLTEVPEMNFTTAESIGCPGVGGTWTGGYYSYDPIFNQFLYNPSTVVRLGDFDGNGNFVPDQENVNLPGYLAGCAVRDDLVKLLIDLQNLRLAVENISAVLRR